MDTKDETQRVCSVFYSENTHENQVVFGPTKSFNYSDFENDYIFDLKSKFHNLINMNS